MARVLRVFLVLLLAVGTARMVAYLTYAGVILPSPLETFHLEAKMVLLAWRAQHGLSLYPAWWDYPHVANIFGPVYFLLVGLMGRLVGVDVPGLFLIGRSTTFVASLLTTLILVVWLCQRYGRGAALAGGLVSLGSLPMYGFTVMVRSDTAAELLGVAGFFLTGSRSRLWRLAGVALLILSALTKQTAGIFLLAAALALALEGRWRHALGVLGGGLAGLAVVVVAVNTLFEPHFARSLFGASTMPWDFDHWRQLLLTLALASPDILILPVVGLWLWLGERPRDVRSAALVLVLLASSLGLSAMVGADLNYYLSLRVAEGMAVGALWHAASAASGRRRSAALLVAIVLAIGALVPGTLRAVIQANVTRNQAMFLEGPAGRPILRSYQRAINLARDPKVHLLTDSGLLDLYQGERAAFGDPWLFRNLVDMGQIRPTRMLELLDSQGYDLIVTYHDIFSNSYETYSFGLPMILIERARARYVPIGSEAGLFFYGRRAGEGSPVPIASPPRVFPGMGHDASPS